MIRLNARQFIPFCFTVAALVAGLFSILKTAAGEYMEAAQFIILSMLLDGLDGNLARWLKGTSKFGAELDTFVDIISFGVAPAVLAYQYALKDAGLWGQVMVSMIVTSGAMRLARFRLVDPYRGQRGYLGLPITVSAGWTAMMIFVVESRLVDDEIFTLAHGPFAAFVWGCAVVMLVLQVSQVRYPKHTKDLMFFVPSSFLVLLLFLRVQLGVSAALAMCVYGFVYAFVTPFLPRHRAVVDESEEEEPLSLHHP